MDDQVTIKEIYRVIQSQNFGGALTGEGAYAAAHIRRVDVTPRISRAGQSGKHTPGMFIDKNNGHRLTIREFRADEITPSHFVIG